MKEEATTFGSTGSLVGVITGPQDQGAASGRPAVMLLDAGIVHRVGPHRLYVKLARQLAASGFVVLRFDFAGIGDSRVGGDHVPFERSAVADTREAMDFMSAVRNVDRFVLMALCSGAGFSFRAACLDPRVAGVILINPAAHRWGTSDERNRTLVHHYLRMMLTASFRRKNLRKLASLDFDWRTLAGAVSGHLRTAFSSGATEDRPEAERIVADLEALTARGARVLMVYSEGDEGWDYYQVFLRRRLRHLNGSSRFDLKVVGGANHTFSLLRHQHELAHVVSTWVKGFE